MSLSVDIKLSRLSKIYHEGETLHGIVQVLNGAATDAKFDAIVVVLDGNVTLQFGNRNAGPFEAFTSSAKTLPLIYSSLQIAPAGHFAAGLTEFPFEFALVAQRDPQLRLYETYHGVFVAVNYALRCEVRRAFLAKSHTKSCTFVVQNRAQVPTAPASSDPKAATAAAAAVTRPPGNGVEPVNFTVSPESVARTAKERIVIPRFLITGRLDRSEWCVSQPITGQLTVQHTDVAIKSIECQLIRVETSCADGTPSDGESRSFVVC